MPKLNANLSIMFNEVEFTNRFAAAARAGFKGVEFLFPYAYDKQQLAEVARGHKLQVVLFNMPPGDFEAGDYALALGCKQLHCMAGLKPRGVNEEKMRETYIDNLRFAGRELAKHGLTLLVEAINTRDIPGFYLNTSCQALDIMHYAAVPNLKFQYDIYHMQIMEGDLAPTIEKHLDKIGHMQLADTPGRHEPGTRES